MKSPKKIWSKTMIELTETNIEKATAKSRIAKPLVKVIEFRRYEVRNRETGATYEVKLTKIGNRKFGECNCKAGQAGKHLCYHISSCLPIHLVLASQAQVI